MFEIGRYSPDTAMDDQRRNRATGIPSSSAARRGLTFGLLVASLFTFCSCRQSAPPDEPRAAGIAANREAAVDRFSPASYDYFRGMDAKAVSSDSGQRISAEANAESQKDLSVSPTGPLVSDQVTGEANGKTAYPAEVVADADAIAEPNWSDSEVKGRNAWILWTAGNEAFWDWLARHGYGTIDLLKLVDSRQRDSRFARAGMINEPGTRSCTEIEAKQTYGIYLDRLVGSPTSHYRDIMRPSPAGDGNPADQGNNDASGRDGVGERNP
ncbi:hypothetical protein, partial [Rhodopirellula bahusiensis]|uniref:hypothetical protein n=1 Tax=Rhodopirellula bahusiensis TaxID=2014065 RepID=UPI003297F9A1